MWSTNLTKIARDMMKMPSPVMFKSRSVGASNRESLILLTEVKRLITLLLHYVNLEIQDNSYQKNQEY